MATNMATHFVEINGFCEITQHLRSGDLNKKKSFQPFIDFEGLPWIAMAEFKHCPQLFELIKIYFFKKSNMATKVATLLNLYLDFGIGRKSFCPKTGNNIS